MNKALPSSQRPSVVLRGESLLHGLALACACTLLTCMLITAAWWLLAHDRVVETMVGAGILALGMLAAAAGLFAEYGEAKGIVKR